MKGNKFVLPILIFLALIFIPSAAYGYYYHIQVVKSGGNLEHLHKIDNTIYYYDPNGSFIGTYVCKNVICDTAKSMDDDVPFNKFLNTNKELQLYNNEYVFISDGDNIILYNAKKGAKIAVFTIVNDYSIGLDNNSVIVKDESGTYGMLNMDTITTVLPLDYEYIGLAKRLNNGLVDTSLIAVKQNGLSYLMNSNFIINTEKSELDIYDYNNKLVVYTDNNYYKIYNFSGDELSEQYSVSDYYLNDDYVIILSMNNVYVLDGEFSNVLKIYNAVTKFKVEDGLLKTYDADDVLQERIELSEFTITKEEISPDNNDEISNTIVESNTNVTENTTNDNAISN